ncbi:DUF4440 domain-containing protein [Nocardia sp. NPDC004168]|uniref:DUF4440 domain-containing protein n=1 Tax=Nocardia sp. NPDC004168 TaxID=3154452 RepID=UPI0033B730C8
MDTRPAFGESGARDVADEVAKRLAHGLQYALEAGHADAYDEPLAADVRWGGPFGALVVGYDRLIQLHRALMQRNTAPPSRFEVVDAFSPALGIVVAQIRRQAVDPSAFSEVAMYVLVERDERWWVAAAQNAPIDPTRSAIRLSDEIHS